MFVRAARLTVLAPVPLLLAAVASAQCPPQWEAIGAPGTNNAIYAMTRWDPDGPGPLPERLVVGGNFSMAGGAVANQIAAWDGTAWSTFGTNFFLPGGTAAVQALAVLPSHELVAGGNFRTASGVQALFVARWTGSAWAPMGSGFDSEVRALAVLPGGTLVAGGTFTLTGTTEVARVARWDGTNWQPFNDPPASGNGVFGGPVNAIFPLSAGDFIIGGEFTSTFGANTRGIARWDTSISRFAAYGNGIFGSVQTILLSTDNRLFVGGGFMTVNGGPADNITEWDGSQWISVGTGMNQAVLDLAQASDGTLIAGGTFTNAGGVAAQRIAAYQSGVWSSLGAGVSHVNASNVRALVPLPEGSMAVGGFFTSAGGGPAGYVARLTITGLSADFNGDGDIGTDADIESFFACLAGTCCDSCGSADFNNDGDIGTDADIETFFRVLAGGGC